MAKVRSAWMIIAPFVNGINPFVIRLLVFGRFFEGDFVVSH
jgi:hypothetical protein